MRKILFIVTILNGMLLLQAQQSLDITYVANTGFLISGDTNKVLIDGIFNEGYGAYYTPTEQTLIKERNSTAPFDSVDIMLITHQHADHINPEYLTEHMVNDNKVILLAPSQVVDLLKPLSDYNAIKNRIRPVTQANQSILDTTIDGIRIKSMALKHIDSASYPAANLGYIFTIDSLKIFHPGDADSADMSMYSNLDLADDSIDIALIPHWFFLGENGINCIKYLKPKAIIITHLQLLQQTLNSTYYRNRIKDITGIPPVYFMEAPMEKLSFIKENDTLSTFSGSKYGFLGQDKPGDTPVLFAPGIVSLTTRDENNITISSDGKQIFYSTMQYPDRITMFLEFKNGSWTTPDTASFSKHRPVDEPFITRDGNRVFFNTNNATNLVGNFDISYADKLDSVWSDDAVSLGTPVNTVQDDYHACIVTDNSIYYTDFIGDIFRSQCNNGIYQMRVKLDYPVNGANTGQMWGDPYVAYDESYMIFQSNRSGGFGGIDLYITYKKADGTWTNPKNLGSKINTSEDDADGDITGDGLYMIFNRQFSDLYWVSATFIDNLNQTNFIPYVRTQIEAQTDTVGHPFSFTIPGNIFIDDDGNNTLTYEAKLTNGNLLPSWLPFDPLTRTFSGTLLNAGTLNIRVKVTDTAMTSDSCDFTIEIISPSGLPTVEELDDVIVYPVPTDGKFSINTGSIQGGNGVLEVYNLQGKCVYTGVFHGDSSEVFDLSGNSQGIYLIKLVMKDSIIYRKISLE